MKALKISLIIFSMFFLAACGGRDSGVQDNVNVPSGSIAPGALPDSTSTGSNLESNASKNSGSHLPANAIINSSNSSDILVAGRTHSTNDTTRANSPDTTNKK